MSQDRDLDIFRRFSILNSLEDALFRSLCKQLEIQKADGGVTLFQIGDTDTQDYFLTQGKITLIDKSGKRRTIEAGMPNSNIPIASTRPRQQTAITDGPATFFTINSAVLKQINDKKKRDSDSLSIFNLAQTQSSQEALFKQFQHELNQGYFVLPSFPETALQIKNKIDQEQCDIHELVSLIQSDPGLSAKLIKTANSPLYRGVSDCNDITNAVMRLGLATTKQMAMSFALLSLFESDSLLLKQQMEMARKKCIHVACLAFVLSLKIDNLNPEEALLSGLLYPIGKIIVLSYRSYQSK